MVNIYIKPETLLQTSKLHFKEQKLKDQEKPEVKLHVGKATIPKQGMIQLTTGKVVPEGLPGKYLNLFETVSCILVEVTSTCSLCGAALSCCSPYQRLNQYFWPCIYFSFV